MSIIPGDGIRLRPLAEGDTERIVRWRSRPEVVAGLFSERGPTAEEHERWFKSYLQDDHRQEFVIEMIETGQPVGTIGLNNLDFHHMHGEFGVLIGEDSVRGKGIAHKAGVAILRYAFKELGLERVYLLVFPGNEAANRLYHRLGFVEEGILRNHIFKDNEFRDVVMMSVLVEDFNG